MVLPPKHVLHNVMTSHLGYDDVTMTTVTLTLTMDRHIWVT